MLATLVSFYRLLYNFYQDFIEGFCQAICFGNVYGRVFSINLELSASAYTMAILNAAPLDVILRGVPFGEIICYNQDELMTLGGRWVNKPDHISAPRIKRS